MVVTTSSFQRSDLNAVRISSEKISDRSSRGEVPAFSDLVVGCSQSFRSAGSVRARGRPRSASCETPVVGYLRLALSRDLAIDDASNGQALRTRDNGRGMLCRPCLLLQPMPTCCCVDSHLVSRRARR